MKVGTLHQQHYECTCHIWEQHQLQVTRVVLKSYDDVSLVIFDPKFLCIDGNWNRYYILAKLRYIETKLRTLL